ncbi:Uma2 family endonuclease [Gemmata sp.]|uniref:Uma2 family endonuclease n=1 Tax=Gemmata sp. TaxID=1914242 RepID=UPI003F72C107
MTPAPATPAFAPPAAPFPSGALAPARPTQHRWTIAEYRTLGETGLFRGVKTMLIRGEVFTMTMPAPPHDVAPGLLDDWLRAAFAPGFHVRNQMGFDIGTDSDPGPDLAVVTGTRRDYAGRTPTRAVLVAEVADSSLSFDLTTKAELYATAGVPEYWVLDLNGRQLHVFRDPHPLPAPLGATAYRSHAVLTDADAVTPHSAPAASVRVADLLP